MLSHMARKFLSFFELGRCGKKVLSHIARKFLRYF